MRFIPSFSPAAVVVKCIAVSIFAYLQFMALESHTFLFFYKLNVQLLVSPTQPFLEILFSGLVIFFSS